MRHIETLFLEVKILDDGGLIARRKDGRRLTDQDRQEARQLADSLPEVTVDDVLRIFPGAKVITSTKD